MMSVVCITRSARVVFSSPSLFAILFSGIRGHVIHHLHYKLHPKVQWEMCLYACIQYCFADCVCELTRRE